MCVCHDGHGPCPDLDVGPKCATPFCTNEAEYRKNFCGECLAEITAEEEEERERFDAEHSARCSCPECSPADPSWR